MCDSSYSHPYQVAVKYWRNVASLSIDMSTHTQPTYRSTCPPTLSRHIDRDVSVNIATDMLVDMSTDTFDTSAICRLTYRSSIGPYVHRQSTDMSTDISVKGRGLRKLHMIPERKEDNTTIISFSVSLSAGLLFRII